MMTSHRVKSNRVKSNRVKSNRVKSKRDSGMTLVELIVVTTLLGLVTTVIAAAFTTVLRAGPATQYRIDDARSVRALQTWLVRDVASTPPREMTVAADLNTGGYIFSDDTTSWVPPAQQCGSGSGNILYMAWKDANTPTRYQANYRIDAGRITRSLCSTSPDSISTITLGGDVSTDFCSASGFSAAYSFPTTSGIDVDSVEICIRSLEADNGLNAGGGDSEDIVLSVSSRNYVETP